MVASWEIARSMKGLYGGIEQAARVSVWISGFALLAVAFLVSADVISRKWLGATLAGSDEISGYVLACTSAWAYSYCLLRRGHIRIDVGYNLVGLRLRSLFDILGVLLLLVFMAFFTHRAVGVLTQSLESSAVSNTPLLTPLWIPQAFWVGGLLFFTLTLIVVALRAILLFARGDLAAVHDTAGIPSIAEEIDEELRSGRVEQAPARDAG